MTRRCSCKPGYWAHIKNNYIIKHYMAVEVLCKHSTNNQHFDDNHLSTLSHTIGWRVWLHSWCCMLLLPRQKVWLSAETPKEVKLKSKQSFFMTFSPFLMRLPLPKLQPEEQPNQCLMLLLRSLSLSAWKSPSAPNYHQMVSQCAVVHHLRAD